MRRSSIDGSSNGGRSGAVILRCQAPALLLPALLCAAGNGLRAAVSGVRGSCRGLAMAFSQRGAFACKLARRLFQATVVKSLGVQRPGVWCVAVLVTKGVRGVLA